MTPLPSKAEIEAWVRENPDQATKRDIAKAFGIKGDQRIDLKALLREMEADGTLTRHKSRLRSSADLPPVTVLRVEGIDDDGDVIAIPAEWASAAPPPRITLQNTPGMPSLGVGEAFLGKLTPDNTENSSYTAKLIRKIGSNPERILGVYHRAREGGRIQGVDKGANQQWLVPQGAENGAKEGELVEAEQTGKKGRMGLPKARVVERLGDPSAPRAVSLIAIHQHGIPDHFSDAAMAEADAAKPVVLGEREDLRGINLVTIDPADARDRDDAIFARPDDDPKNAGGFVLWVGIADVAHYVRPGSALDEAARERGNSTYFPDRVVPMLPDILSGDMCSLHEEVERACMAVEMRINDKGEKIAHRFTRGLMRSRASLNYEEAQAAIDGQPNDKTAPLLEPVLKPLMAAYEALKIARAKRQPLELDLPERRIELAEDGTVASIAEKERLDMHRLIEEFMVLANVAAAEELIKLRQAGLYRVHEEPNPEKLDTLRKIAQASGFGLPKGQVLQTAQLNRLLAQARDTESEEVVSMSTLRAMTQAYYSPTQLSHFGLALKHYSHFTSPIRRYADLIVHRALIRGHGWGVDGLTDATIGQLDEIAQHISETERRSMMAERDTTDRYMASYLAERVGQVFAGTISGVAKFGFFVKLAENGADVLVPMRSIGDDYYKFDAETGVLYGKSSGLQFSLGMPVEVKLDEAVPVTGGMSATLVSVEHHKVPKPSGGRHKHGKSRTRKPRNKPGRDPGATRKSAQGKSRKVKRRR